jgi:hypothetical protein
VGQGVAHRGRPLATAGELRPHRGNRVVETDEPGIDQLEEEQAHDGFADRIEVDHRAGLPGPLREPVGPAPDQVDDHLSVDDHADGAPYLAPLGEIGGECLPHGAECIDAATVDHRACPSLL